MKTSILLSLLLCNSAFALDVGSHAPATVLDQLGTNGQIVHHSITDSRAPGQKVILEFFQVTCEHCLQSFPVVNQMAVDLGQKVTYRLVVVNSSEDDLRGFIQSNPGLIQHETALDIDWDATQDYDVTETPTLFVLDSTGTVIYKNVGLVTSAVAAEIEKAVN